MKRFWLGVGLMAALLALGIFETHKVHALTHPVVDMVEKAGEAAAQANWEQAAALLEEAQSLWEKHWGFLSAMHHHGPMEEIDSQFSRAEALLESRSSWEFSANCARLAELIRAMGEGHQLNLQNLLQSPGPAVQWPEPGIPWRAELVGGYLPPHPLRSAWPPGTDPG